MSETKVCTKCGIEKPLTKEYWCRYIRADRKSKLYWSSRCLMCSDRWHTAKFSKKEKNSFSASSQQRMRKKLSDGYVKATIYSAIKRRTGYTMRSSEMTTEAVELKREQIMLNRELKQIKKEVHDGTIGKGNTGIEKFEKGLPDKED